MGEPGDHPYILVSDLHSAITIRQLEYSRKIKQFN